MTMTFTNNCRKTLSGCGNLLRLSSAVTTCRSSRSSSDKKCGNSTTSSRSNTSRLSTNNIPKLWGGEIDVEDETECSGHSCEFFFCGPQQEKDILVIDYTYEGTLELNLNRMGLDTVQKLLRQAEQEPQRIQILRISGALKEVDIEPLFDAVMDLLCFDSRPWQDVCLKLSFQGLRTDAFPQWKNSFFPAKIHCGILQRNTAYLY